MTARRRRLAALVSAVALVGCTQNVRTASFRQVSPPARPEVGLGPLHVVWSKPLVPEMYGAYVPVEHASAALDPTRNRVYVGSSEGILLALTSSGNRVWAYDADARISAAPALDADRGELYVATDGGGIHALTTGKPEQRWVHALREPIGQTPVLAPDAVYVVTDAGTVLALSRANGELLWRYRRDLPEGLGVTGHAGLRQVDGMLVTGFTDGSVVALDAADGRVVWERDLTLDVDLPREGAPRFVDVDTTPVLDGESLYVASFAAGLYALTPSNGSIQWREPDMVGVTSLVLQNDQLLLSSAERGLVHMAMPERSVVWERPFLRGAPSEARVVDGIVYVGESEGAFLALDLATGSELARLEFGTGFSAPAAVEQGLGFVLGNGATLFGFSMGTPVR